MRIDNTFDSVMYAASIGVEPNEDDLASVVTPPSMTAAEFRDWITSAASEVAKLSREGMNGRAREEATKASSIYLAAFEGPKPAGTEVEDIDVTTARMFDLPTPTKTDPTDVQAIGHRMFRS